MSLAVVAAALGLAATIMAVRTLKPMSTAVAPVMLLAALVMLLPACTSARLSARIVLPSTTMAAGSEMSGKVTVDNETGHPLHIIACGSPFQVVLGNDKVPAAAYFPACGFRVTIPSGESQWPVTVLGSYSSCGGQSASGAPQWPRCIDGLPPPLPAGDYKAMFFQEPRVVPTPPSISIRVTP
jgi:hypothetical protein